MKTTIRNWTLNINIKYDLNVIIGLVYRSLEKLNDNDNGRLAVSQIIKRNNDYMVISTKWFKFLDIKSTTGCSYKQFLAAYKCQDEKGFFPYDCMDKLVKLSATSLPPHESFHNELQNSRGIRALQKSMER